MPELATRNKRPGTLPHPLRSEGGAWSLGLVSWALYDWANSAFWTVIQTFVFATYFARQVATDEAVGSLLWGITLSAAGLIVALGGPVLGAVADQGGRRKPWIAVFTALCISATALLWFVQPSPDYVPLALVLVGLATIGVEFALVFYNAMLSGLAPRGHVGRWSGWSWGLGYAGGLACLAAALFVFVQPDNPWWGLERQSAEHLRATFILVAGWYLLFALPLFLFTPDHRPTGKRLFRAVRDGLDQLRASFHQARRHGPLIRFLAANMLYFNGLATLFVFGGIYAAGTFGLTESQVLTFGIALNVTSGLGAAGFAWVDDWIGGKRTIVLALIALATLSTLLLLIESTLLFWVVGSLLGIFLGPVQAASRSYLARVAPEPLQNELFGLSAFAGKATVFVGPLLVGWLTYWTGSQRIGMTPIVGFFVIGLAVMLTVPADRK